MVACALPGALSTTERKRIPAKWFGLPALRSYPLARMVAGKPTPSPSHARNALARASQQLDRGTLTAVQYAQIVSRAGAVLAECKSMATKKKKPMSAAKRREFAERMKRARAAKKKNPAKKKTAKKSNPAKKKTAKKKTAKKRGTRKGDIRKTARRAYTKKKNPAKKSNPAKSNPPKKKAAKKRKPKPASVGIEAYMEEVSIKKACGF